MRIPRARHVLTASLAAVLVAGTFLPQSAADVRYAYAAMDASQEVPPVPSPATGEAIWIVDLSSGHLHYEITFQDLTSPEVQAHVHGPAPPGSTGAILEHLPVGSPKIGTWFPTATELGHFMNVLTYVNIHSVNFPSGEMRGWNQTTFSRGYCFGDGSGTACPCNNPGGPYEGCANTTGAGGRLRPAGFPTGGGSQMRFIADQLPGAPALLFVGTTALNGGNGVSFGDGLRCAGGTVLRLGIKLPDASGRVEWGPGLHTEGGWAPGQLRRLQVWYRDPAGGGVCGNSFNFTNGVEVAFQS